MIRNSGQEQNQIVQRPFFGGGGASSDFGGKIPQFQTEIELLSLTKLCEKEVSPPRNLLNQQKIDAYACV